MDPEVPFNEINGLLTVPGVAREIGVSDSTVRRALIDGRITLDFCTFPACTALFKRSSIPAIREAILPQPPETPEGCVAVYGRTPGTPS